MVFGICFLFVSSGLSVVEGLTRRALGLPSAAAKKEGRHGR